MTDVGTGNVLTASILLESGRIPSAETRNTRKLTEERAKWHFDGLSFKLASRKRSKTAASGSKWSSNVDETTLTSSIYTKQTYLLRPCSTRCINRWKVGGAFVKPKLRTLYSHNPACDMKAVLSIELVSMAN